MVGAFSVSVSVAGEIFSIFGETLIFFGGIFTVIGAILAIIGKSLPSSNGGRFVCVLYWASEAAVEREDGRMGV